MEGGGCQTSNGPRRTVNRVAKSCCEGWGDGQELHCAILFFKSRRALRMVKDRGLRFALVLCIKMCTIYATRQAHRRQPLGICFHHRTKSRITMRVQPDLGHSDGEPHVSTSVTGSQVLFMKSLIASVFHAPRTARLGKKILSRLDGICPLPEVIRMFLMLTCSIRSSTGHMKPPFAVCLRVPAPCGLLCIP